MVRFPHSRRIPGQGDSVTLTVPTLSVPPYCGFRFAILLAPAAQHGDTISTQLTPYSEHRGAHAHRLPRIRESGARNASP
jgi:hypothetical protein